MYDRSIEGFAKIINLISNYLSVDLCVVGVLVLSDNFKND